MDRIVSVIGLGYVGLPVAVAFGQKKSTIGFDINQARIAQLRDGIDTTGEVSESDLKSSQIEFTTNPQELAKANFHIVAVPTPIDNAKRPDLTPVHKATLTVGSVLKKGDIVVYESTVYPGLTDEYCVPLLEKCSSLKAGVDFFVGYSPERINPGDKEHSFTKIKKIVAAQTPESLNIVADVYSSVVEAGVFKASSIKVAEAAKVIENSQRDINIAFINELSIIFNHMGLNTLEVLEAAGTKWNFLKFTPGLVGGHCIGVDPYYLTHKAETFGYHPQVILAGRRINDGMGKFIAEKTIKMMLQSEIPLQKAKVSILGLTFKENCPDIRNTKVIDIIQELKDYGVTVQVYDPLADKEDTHEEYGITLCSEADLQNSDAVVLAVAHKEFSDKPTSFFNSIRRNKAPLVDVKGVLRNRSDISKENYWNL